MNSSKIVSIPYRLATNALLCALLLLLLVVSIPYRLATNEKEEEHIAEDTGVSIPYRLATNHVICKVNNQILRQFQSLIGWLQTTTFVKRTFLNAKFQSLIGWLQTRHNVLTFYII